MNTFQEFRDWIFTGVLSFSAVSCVMILAALYRSIQDLNVKLAVVIEKVTSHEKTIDRHDERLSRIEEKL